jgi:broad specificity phosphatase PhoE
LIRHGYSEFNYAHTI